MNLAMTRTKTPRRGTILALAGTLTGALALGACNATETTLRTPDAPPRITIPNGEDGERVTLRHTGVGNGAIHELALKDGAVEPPLLLDGTWHVELDGKPVMNIEVGGTTSNDLLTCWTGTGKTRPRATTPEGVRCTQALVLRTALSYGYGSAANMIETARAGLEDDSNLWGWYCNIAGDAAAMGAVLAGADGRALIRDETSFCDYSVLHGVGAGTVLLHPGDPIDAVTRACAPDPSAEIPEIARTSQCWHGAGTGFARTTRLDLFEGEKLCRQAPEESSTLNCLEGLFSFTRTYRLRGDDVRHDWPGLAIDGRTCNDLTGSRALLETCYRSSAQTLIHDTADTTRDSGQTRRYVVETMLATCRESSGAHTAECWSGLGTLVANALHPDLDDKGEVKRWIDVCDAAPDETSSLRCFERAALGILINGQLVTGLAIEEIVGLVPVDIADGLRTKLANWAQSLGGRNT